MYNYFYDPYRSYEVEYLDYLDLLHHANKLLELENNEDISEDSLMRQGNNLTDILQIFLNRRQDVLQLIEAYRIPRIISTEITSMIIRFVLNNASQITGNVQQRAEQLFNRFINRDRVVVPVLRLFRVPDNVLYRYIREVILVTLRNINTQPVPEPDTNPTVRRILRELEVQHPNFFGLTVRYNILQNAARQIARDIIEFTVLNLNSIQQVGTLQQRADSMLRLLDSEKPELIKRMIRRGVPAAQAEAITRQIILFTLQRVPLPR